jgi:hypothetical protein
MLQLLPVQEKGGSPIIAQIEFRLHWSHQGFLILVNVMIADENKGAWVAASYRIFSFQGLVLPFLCFFGGFFSQLERAQGLGDTIFRSNGETEELQVY